MTRLKRTITMAVAAAALAAPTAGAESGEFVPGVTDFPSANRTERFVPGATDFPSVHRTGTGYHAVVSAQRPVPVPVAGDGFAWDDAGIGAGVGVVLTLLAVGSALALRRRETGALAIPAYLFAFLALDTAGQGRQLAIAAVTWLVLAAACVPLPGEQRLRVALVIVAATIGEVTGSILWGVYSYRLENLPVYVPPGHGLVYLAGLGLAVALRRHTRALVGTAAFVAAAWGIAGLLFLPRLDVAGALGVPLLLLFLWRGRNRAVYAGVFAVVCAIELYGTWLGIWVWHPELPGLGIPDGNPPSGVASGYVCFDVFAVALGSWFARARWISGIRTPTASSASTSSTPTTG